MTLELLDLIDYLYIDSMSRKNIIFEMWFSERKTNILAHSTVNFVKVNNYLNKSRRLI